MTNYKREDIVLVDFGFSEKTGSKKTGSKKRPALIISSENYHKSCQEVIIAAVTSNIKRVLFGDTKIEQWKEAGLIRPALITGIVRTIKSNMIVRKLGSLSKQDFQKAQKNLGKAIGF